MSRYIVIKDLLNVRNQPKLVDEFLVGSLSYGEEVELDDKTIAGDIPPDSQNDQWHFDEFNRFVSAAGVAFLDSYIGKKTEFIANANNVTYIDGNDRENEQKWKVSWGHVDMEVWRLWKFTRGKGVKVAVIDTGVHNDINDLNGQIKICKSYVRLSDESIDPNTRDLDPYHGTKSAGIIGANGLTAKQVYGVAPDCELLLYKATDEFYNPIQIAAIIQQAVADGARIVSMSFDCGDHKILKGWISKASLENNVIFVASAGDLPTGDPAYPASYTGCFSIGAYFLDDNKNRTIYSDHSNFNEFVFLMGPGRDILTTSIDANKAFHQDTSSAAAFLAGYLALLIALKPSLNYEEIVAMLNSNNLTDNIEKSGLKSDKEGYGILNTRKILSLLNLH
jgi:subtilisin family serine protease